MQPYLECKPLLAGPEHFLTEPLVQLEYRTTILMVPCAVSSTVVLRALRISWPRPSHVIEDKRSAVVETRTKSELLLRGELSWLLSSEFRCRQHSTDICVRRYLAVAWRSWLAAYFLDKENREDCKVLSRVDGSRHDDNH